MAALPPLRWSKLSSNWKEFVPLLQLGSCGAPAQLIASWCLGALQVCVHACVCVCVCDTPLKERLSLFLLFVLCFLFAEYAIVASCSHPSSSLWGCKLLFHSSFLCRSHFPLARSAWVIASFGWLPQAMSGLLGSIASGYVNAWYWLCFVSVGEFHCDHVCGVVYSTSLLPLKHIRACLFLVAISYV